MALELRPNCELCDCDLPAHSDAARICSFECTFCARCVAEVLHDVCPNCGGGFAPRPIRPSHEWRAGLSLAQRPPATARVSCRYTRSEIEAFARRLCTIRPGER